VSFKPIPIPKPRPLRGERTELVSYYKERLKKEQDKLKHLLKEHEADIKKLRETDVPIVTTRDHRRIAKAMLNGRWQNASSGGNIVIQAGNVGPQPLEVEDKMTTSVNAWITLYDDSSVDSLVKFLLVKNYGVKALGDSEGYSITGGKGCPVIVQLAIEASEKQVGSDDDTGGCGIIRDLIRDYFKNKDLPYLSIIVSGRSGASGWSAGTNEVYKKKPPPEPKLDSSNAYSYKKEDSPEKKNDSGEAVYLQGVDLPLDDVAKIVEDTTKLSDCFFDIKKGQRTELAAQLKQAAGNSDA
jgi:hypothetical protein